MHSGQLYLPPPPSATLPSFIEMYQDGMTVFGTKPPMVGKDGWQGKWKVHLNVLGDLDNPTTQALVEWGIQNRHLIEQFKVGHDSGQEGKGMTI